MADDTEKDRVKRHAASDDQAAAFASLSRFLAPRIQQARDGILSDKSISDIKQDARRLSGL